MKTVKILCISAASLLLALSCKSPHYAPNMGLNALHTDGGQAVVMLGGGSSGFSPHLSLSVSENFAISASGNLISSDDKQYQYAEGGLTYFNYNDKPLHYSFSVGPGAGWVYSTDVDSLNNSDLYFKFYRFYAQPSVGIATELIDTYLNLKFSYLQSPQIWTANGYKTGSNLFFEPALGFQTGYKFLKVYAQLQLALPLMQNSDIAYAPVQINLGIRTKFPLKSK